MSEFAVRAGSVLRQARRRRGLTLHAVCELSGGSLKPSTLAGYEHGSRAITLERFSELSSLYGLPADRLLNEVLATEVVSPKDAVVRIANIDRASGPRAMVSAAVDEAGE